MVVVVQQIEGWRVALHYFEYLCGVDFLRKAFHNRNDLG